MTKLLIIGHARHGKDTVAEIITKMTGMEFISSSEAALDAIWPSLKVIKGYKNKQHAFDDRTSEQNRLIWKSLITLYNTPIKSTLAKEVLKNSDIYVGMRCQEEFAKAKDLFDHIIWVDATGRVKTKDSSMGICFQSNNMELLSNNGSLEELEQNIIELLDKLKIKINPKNSNPTSEIGKLIVDWANQVFPNRTINNAIQKMVFEEIPEYMLERDPLELADIGILLYDIANLAGIDLDAAIREKMKINKQREWEIDKTTGLMNHINLQCVVCKGEDKSKCSCNIKY